MYTARPRLRPLTFTELLDETFALYRRNFALFAGVTAILAIPEAVINIVLTIVEPAPSSFITTSGGETQFDRSLFANYATIAGTSNIVSGIFGALITGALAVAISKRYLGRGTTIGDVYREIGLRGFGILLVASFCAKFLEILGFLALIVGFFYLLVSFQFVAQAVVLEHKGILGSLRRSWQLIRGSWWRVCGMAIVLTLIVGIATSIIDYIVGALLAILGGVGGRAATAALASVVGILVQPVLPVGLTLLYYDLRIRKEGFDLEQMVDSMRGAWAR